jgi:molybdate transport system ATP-binding protein
MTLSVRLRHDFPSVRIDVAFDVPSPGITVLFGPSGAGKSTVILAAAGLLRPDTCRIDVDGQVMADTETNLWLPPERRRAGLVFQDAKLFPHMSVATNLRFGLRRAPPGSVAFDEVVELLGIGGLLDRRPHTLSGGERQRVAIGRALLAQPHLLLLDEPLASLDSARKAEILPFLIRLKTALRLPVLYVTHDLDEVTRLADSMVLLEAGRVLGFGPLSRIAARADLPLLARRDDAAAVLHATVVAHDTERELTRLDAGGATLLVPLLDVPLAAELRIRVPAREVILASEPPNAISVHNIVPGTVHQIVPDPSRRAMMVEIALPNGALLSRVTPDAVARLNLTPGGPVLALIKSTSVEVLAS